MDKLPANWNKKIDAKFTAVELDTATDILEFSIEAFKLMLEVAINSNDVQSVKRLRSYIEFAQVFAERLYDLLETGDIENKTFH